jgi:hypothetical protein
MNKKMDFYETLLDYWIKRLNDSDASIEELVDCRVFIRHLTHYLIIQQGV